MTPRNLNFKVYVEGLSIPFIGGSVSAVSGGVSSASVTIPFSRYTTQLRPRTNIIFTYSYSDDLDNLDIPIEYLLFEGDMQSISIRSNASSKTCTLTVTSPLESLKRYRQYVDVSVVGNSPALGLLHVHADSEEINEILAEGAMMVNSSGVALQGLLKNDKFPDAVQNNFKEIVRSTAKDGIYSSLLIHEYYHNYMGQFEAIDLYKDDPLWENFKSDALWEKFMEGIDVLGNQSSPDFYSYMTQVYGALNYQMTDLGVPHTNGEEGSIQGEGEFKRPGQAVKYSRFMLHASNPFINPPACNIIFPDIITQSNIDIHYAAEITRASLIQSPVLGEDGGMFSTLFAAPSSQFSQYTPDKKKTTKDEFLSSSRILGQFYGNNEYFLSPFGKYFHLPSWYESVPKSPGVFSPLFSHGPDAADMGFITGEEYAKWWDSLLRAERIHGFSIRYADLTYLSDKYSSRRGSMTTTFNPKIAVGFPSVVIDNDLPFFGLVASVTHSFAASGAASTAMQYTHVTTSLDYMNPDLRNAAGISTVLTEENISSVYEDIGLGNSFHSFVKATVGGQPDVASSLAAKDLAVDRGKIRDLKTANKSPFTLKLDEKFSRLFDLQSLLEDSLKGTASDESLNLFLKKKSCRIPIQPSLKEGGDVAKGYWFTGDSLDASVINSITDMTYFLSLENKSKTEDGPEDIYSVRRRVAELLTIDLRSTDIKTKIDLNIENSILSILNDSVCPKTQGEIAGIELKSTDTSNADPIDNSDLDF
tara:strand:+ start:1567 stop:3843 length:2277 start_codon:yes stop_codon:yes gene_type:complete